MGTLLGIEIRTRPFSMILLVLVLLVFGALSSISFAAIAFGSVVLHELGHAVVARRMGVRVSWIELGFLGGAAKIQGVPSHPNQEIAIAGAGPAVSLALAGLGVGLGAWLDAPILTKVGSINLLIGGFNLIPALPTDGGRMLRAALSGRMSYVRATDITVLVSRVVAIGYGVWGLVFGPIYLLILAPAVWLVGTNAKKQARKIKPQRGDALEDVDGRLVIAALD